LRTAIFTQDVDAPLSPRPFTGLPSDTAVETFDISPDGRMLLTAEQELQANIYALENVPGVKKSSRKIE